MKQRNFLQNECTSLALTALFFALVARANPNLPHFLLITVSVPHPSSVSRAVYTPGSSNP